MFILNKKRILIIFMCLVVSISFATLSNKKMQSVETVALPIENKVIIIDAGHGSPDEGASSNDGLTEANINLSIALKVQNLLEEAGSTVILTRSDENGIYDEESSSIREKKVSDIKNRVKIGNESSADIFVSIHLNKLQEQQYWGWQTFFKKGNENSKKLAESLQNGLNEIIQKENKRQSLKIENIYIIDHVEIPTAIVECGFLSNEEEKNLLKTDEYQNKIAWGIYVGIMNYFY